MVEKIISSVVFIVWGEKGGAGAGGDVARGDGHRVGPAEEGQPPVARHAAAAAVPSSW